MATAPKCFQAKAGQLQPQWFIIDATDQVVGRLAAQIAPILMGKHRPTYTPHIDTGDYVIVTNVDKVRFSGKKWQQKIYQRYTGYPGGQWEEVAAHLFARKPEKILELAIRRMLPKNKLGRHMMSKLKLVVGPTHPHQAQQPIPLEPVTARPAAAGALYRPEPAPPKPRIKKAAAEPTAEPEADVAVAPTEAAAVPVAPTAPVAEGAPLPAPAPESAPPAPAPEAEAPAYGEPTPPPTE